jgi:hypothetical protein
VVGRAEPASENGDGRFVGQVNGLGADPGSLARETGALSELPLALGKVFAKLGMTSRSQLGSVMPSDPAPSSS